MKVFDTHFHLYQEDDEETIISTAREAGVTYMMNIGVELENSIDAFERAKRNEGVFSSAGVHPLHIDDFKGDYQPYIDLLKEEKVRAVGEIGLDYYYSQDNKEYQKEVFAEFLKISHQIGKPAVIHCRDAFDDCLELIETHLKKEQPFILHCYTGDKDTAQKVVDLGGYVSYSGICTFKNAQSIRDSLEVVPGDRILIETDSPYLAPVPFRGKRNQPAYVVYVLEKVAEIIGLSVEETAELTTNNAFKVLNLN